MVTAEHDRSHGELGMEGRLERLDGPEVLVDEGRDPDRRRPEDLGDADRRDGEDQAGGVEEPAHDDEVDQGACSEGNGDADGHGQEVALVPASHHDLGHRRRQHPDLHLGEVDDAAGAIDQHQPHGGEAVEAAEHEAEQDDAERRTRRQERSRDHPDDEDGGGAQSGATASSVEDLRHYWPKQWTWVWGCPYADGSLNGKYLPPSHATHAPLTPSKSEGRFGSQ